MSTTYDGDDTNFPTSITLPSDGDAADAASVNAALEGLADRTAFLLQGWKKKEWTSDTTWTAPADCGPYGILVGYGGGGGGGFGAAGDTTSAAETTGGGGGGGSVQTVKVVALTPSAV